MQLVCRDRNRLALEAEIAGAALHGIENICCLTGDDVTAGDEPEARRVFDLDSIQLLALGVAIAARHVPLGPQDRPAAAASSSARSRTRRAAVRLPRRPRAEEGARGRAVPPAAGRLRAGAARGVHGRGGRARARRRSARCIPSICLVRSPSALRFIDEHVPGISVPAAIDRALRERRRSRGRVLRGRLRARRARALAAGRRRPAPDQLPPRGRHRPALPASRHSNPSRKGAEWTPFSSRGLRPSSSGPTSRSA